MLARALIKDIINIAAAGAVDQKLLDIGDARARGRAGGRALAILRAGPGRERPGIEKSTVFN